MPEFKYLKNEKLIAIPFEWQETVPYGMVMKKGEERPYIKAFAEMAIKYFRT